MRRILQCTLCCAAAFFLSLSVVGLRDSLSATSGSLGAENKTVKTQQAKAVNFQQVNATSGIPLAPAKVESVPTELKEQPVGTTDLESEIKPDPFAGVLRKSLQSPNPSAGEVLTDLLAQIEPLFPGERVFRKAVVKALREKKDPTLETCLADGQCVDQEYDAILARVKERLVPKVETIPAGEQTLRSMLGSYSTTILAVLCALSLLLSFALLLVRGGAHENKPVTRPREQAPPNDVNRPSNAPQPITFNAQDVGDSTHEERLNTFLTGAVEQLKTVMTSGSREHLEEFRTQMALIHERLDSIGADVRLAKTIAAVPPAASEMETANLTPLVTEALLRIERDKLVSARDAFLASNGDVLGLLQGRKEVESEAFLRQEVGVDLVKSLQGWGRLQDYCKRTVEDLSRFYEVMNTLKFVDKMLAPGFVENADKGLQLKSYAKYSSFMNYCNSAGAPSILQSFKVEKWLREDFLSFSEAFLREYVSLEQRGEEHGLAGARVIVIKALGMAGIEPIPLQIGMTRFSEREHRAKSTVSEKTMPPDVIAGVVRMGFRKKSGEIIQQLEVLVNRV